MSSIIAVALVLIVSGIAVAAFVMCCNLVKKVDEQKKEIEQLYERTLLIMSDNERLHAQIGSLNLDTLNLQSQINKLAL